MPFLWRGNQVTEEMEGGREKKGEWERRMEGGREEREVDERERREG